jgi:hypothetical protein
MEIKLNPYQERFLLSRKRYPALIASIATGKTFLGLLKMWRFCEQWPDSLFMLVRKEYTDLRDSTLKDISRYFGVTFDSNKEYTFPNKSGIMARHADELAVLKNVNLSGFLIEQAEEFETDEAFTFLRDRLRRQNCPYRQGLVIANAKGHNYVWKNWINAAQQVTTIDGPTGQCEYINDEYHALTANTFANEHNLPPDFIADLKRMKQDAPHHYAQYVMNSFEEMETDDFVFNFQELLASKLLAFAFRPGYGHTIAGFDIARFGNDKCAAVVIQQVGALMWKVVHVEEWIHKDLDYSTGRILSISGQRQVNDNIIDEDGIGGGPLDFITRGRRRTDFRGFRNKAVPYDDNRFYVNPRTAAAFYTKELVAHGHLAIPQEDIIDELMTLKYKFNNDGRRVLISKDDMRKEGIKSPNKADALLMAVSLIDDVQRLQDVQYSIRPQVSREEDLFKIAGVK